MKKIIYYTDHKENLPLNVISGEDLSVYKFGSIRDVVLFLIENSSFHFVVCDQSNRDDNNADLMDTVFSITPFIDFILFDDHADKNFPKYQPHQKKIKWIHSMEEIETIAVNELVYKRKYNRINWPLEVHFSKKQDMIQGEPGSVLSLSAGGAFIETSNYTFATPGDNLYLIIQFKDFKLYVDSTVIRIHANTQETSDKPGMAVEFHHVSKITQNCIDSIIKDRLASKLLFTVDEIFNTQSSRIN